MTPDLAPYLALPRFPYGKGRMWRDPSWPADDFVVIELSVAADNESIHLGSILTPSVIRGQGRASAALRWVLDTWKGSRIVGAVSPFGSAKNGLGKRALRAWYARAGFNVHRSGLIVRPSGAK